MKTKTTSNPVPLLRGLFTSLLAIAAFFGAPAALLAQTLYVSTDGGPIDKVDSTGAVSLFATMPGGSAPQGLAFDGSGNLYAANVYANQISKITPGGAVSFFATVSTPGGLAFDGNGNLYAADFVDGQIDIITPAGAVSLFATLPGGSFPTGLAFDSSGNLYAADASNGQAMSPA